MRFSRKLKDNAIHWSGAVNDGYGGYTYNAPTEHEVRWQDVQETFIDFEGEEQVSNAIIYTDSPIIRRGSWIKRGRLTDLDSNDTDPKEISDTFPVRAVQESPNLRKKQTLYKVML